jgi:hypothetical protein
MNNHTVSGDRGEVNFIPSSGAMADDPLDMADMICLSPLRWDFARQRPQQLMSRSARERRVFFVEEPVFGEMIPRLDIAQRDCGVFVVTPHLHEGLDDADVATIEQTLLIDELLLEYEVWDYILWYYTPMAIAFTWRLDPLLVVYDCVDEQSAFRSAPPSVKQREDELIELADLVFTNEYSLYEARPRLYHNIHAFPMDETLAQNAWDVAWTRMMDLINLTFKKRYSKDRG